MCTTRTTASSASPSQPGEYDVTISYGPEYDAVFTPLSISGGKDSSLTAQLKPNGRYAGLVERRLS